MSKKPYRPCVGIALFNDDGHVFVGERIDTPGAWQMPQGGIDPGEDIETAAMRELYEETGIKNADILKIAEDTIRYDLPPHLGHLWGGGYAGQQQSWVAMRFTGEESEIDLNAHEIQEFSAYQWVPLPETLDLIVPFKRDVYRKIIAMFSGVL